MKFIISQYSATGEGLTLCLMVINDDIEDQTVDYYFSKFFNDFHASFREYVTKEQFLEYKNYIPEVVQRHINGELTPAPYFMWHSRFYVNYS